MMVCKRRKKEGGREGEGERKLGGHVAGTFIYVGKHAAV
jgi:hypothetical protein